MCRHFTQEWHDAYDQLLAGMKLRKPWPPRQEIPEDEPGHAEEGAAALAQQASAPQYVFALARDHTLQAFDSVDAMSEQVDALEVEDGWWMFYDHDGHALEVSWTRLNRRGLLRSEAGHYQLRRAGSDSSRGPLQHRLATVDQVRGAMRSLAEVREQLGRSMQDRRHA